MKKFILFPLLFPLLSFGYKIDNYVSIKTERTFITLDTLGMKNFFSDNDLGRIAIMTMGESDSTHNGVAGFFRSDSANLARIYENFMSGFLGNADAAGISDIQKQVKRVNGFYVLDYSYSMQVLSSKAFARVYCIKDRFYTFMYFTFGNEEQAKAERESLFSSIEITNCPPEEQYDKWDLNYYAFGKFFGYTIPPVIIIVVVIFLMRLRRKK